MLTMKTNNITMRKAVEKDYPAINSLYYETYNLYYKNIPDTYKKTPKDILPKGTYINMIEHIDSLVIVAEGKEMIVGFLYATIEKDEGDEWSRPYRRVSIEEIGVLPVFAKRGIGTMLIQKAENWAKGKKIEDLTALVYDFNKDALAFYDKNGYKPYSVKLNKKLLSGGNLSGKGKPFGDAPLLT